MKFPIELQIGFIAIGSAVIAIGKTGYEIMTFNIPSTETMFVYTIGSMMLILLGMTFIQDARQNGSTVIQK